MAGKSSKNPGSTSPAQSTSYRLVGREQSGFHESPERAQISRISLPTSKAE